MTPEELAQKIEEITNKLNAITEENTNLKAKNEELQSKLNNIHIDALTKTLDNNKVEEPEEDVSFDFDIK